MYRTESDGGRGLIRDESSRSHLPEYVPRASIFGSKIKRAIDIFGAALLLVVLFPLLIAIAIGVRYSSAGPILYAQKRVGRGARLFSFYKFRSMGVNSDSVLTSFLDSDPEAKERWRQYQKIDNDPRITRFGRFIRRTSLDELPQLWNVLKGDMSLVGPRPCLPQQQDLYGPYWRCYCSKKPGLTGLWQVSGRNKLTYQQRVAMDVAYVRDWSLLLDLKIFLRTIKVVITGDGSH